MIINTNVIFTTSYSEVVKKLKCYALEDYKNWKTAFLPTSSKGSLEQSSKI